MGTMGTHWPTAVVQFSNNSNYLKLLKGGNCLGNIIEVAENVVLVLLFSMAQLPLCKVYNHLNLRKKKLPSYLHLRHIPKKKCFKHFIFSLFKLIVSIET